MEAGDINGQLYRMADHLLAGLWLRQGEALDFLNDVSLFLYALAKEHPDFPGQLKSTDCRNISAGIVRCHAELGQLDYRFGSMLPNVSDDVWYGVIECLRLVASGRQRKQDAGRLFDYLLQQMYVKEKIGNFITPRTLADMMACMLDPKPGQVVLDPVCGSGRLLIAAARRCKNCHYIGIDIDEKIRITAFFYMAFHEVFDKTLYRKDFLEGGWKEQADVILANPPYSDDIHETISFMQGIMDALKPDGRCGILVPEGFLTNTVNRDVIDMRRCLLYSHCLEGVISLPRKLYKPYTVSKSSLILLKKKAALPGEPIFFSCVTEYDGAESEFSDAVYEQDMKRIAKAWEFREKRPDIFWRASPEEIKGKDYIFGADHYRKSNYMYMYSKTESLRESILAGQAELKRHMDNYFREDSVI